MSAGVDWVEAALGRRVVSARPMGAGLADVCAATLDDASTIVIKRGEAPAIAGEAWSLRFLRQRSALPVPRVLAEAPGALAMEFIESDGRAGASVERHAAELLAALHDVAPTPEQQWRGERFGLDRDNAIGGLPQSNAWMPSWVGFFRERRLLHFAEAAAREGRVPMSLAARIEGLAARLGDFLDEPAAPSLIHGDVWAGNVLANGGRIAAFLDPAPYFAHAEVELAFIALFGTFGRPFLDAYAERRPFAPGLHQPVHGQRVSRVDIYNLFPLLVHTRLFGGGYAQQVESIVRRAGF